MQRVLVVGTSCSGKTTLAARLSRCLGVPHVELDALHWRPNWTSTPTEELLPLVDEATRGPKWVCDGNYSAVRDLLWPRADTVIWLNYRFHIVWSRALRRTFRRGITREPLWAGNRESLLRAFFHRDSILLWVLQTYSQNRRRYPPLFRQPEYAHLKVIEFKHPAESESFLAELEQSQRPASERKAI